ncbi:hypothetical protein DFH06DRAFT_1143821 [Mycena polygramma]|nr:hypothetical protein DFH06DRAFT_1143821 [Mycena polygramma]
MPQGNSILDVIGSAARQLPATRRDLPNGAVLMRSAARGGLDSSRVALIYAQLSFHLDGMLMESNGRLPTASRMHVPMFTGIRKRKLNGWSLSEPVHSERQKFGVTANPPHMESHGFITMMSPVVLLS